MKPFNPEIDILALDFDGVIADSIKECLVSGFNAYANYRGHANIERFEQLNADWVQRARAMRNYIRNGEDYIYIAYALEHNLTIASQEDFDAFLAEHKNLRDIFFKQMVDQRLYFSAQYPEIWASLNPLYDGMRHFIDQFNPKENLYIVTTKKLVFVHKILDANNLKLVQANVRDTASGQSKRQIIEEILAQRALQPQNLYFIDDQVDTLIKVKPADVNVSLASWGYNNQAQIEKSKSENIPVLSLEDFYRLFG